MFLVDLWLDQGLTGLKTLRISVHRINDGKPSIRTPVSNEIISASDDECETADCFLHIQDNGTNVFGPTRNKNAPVVDLLSFKSPAKLASENNANLHFDGSSPTRHNWIQLRVLSM